jgi:hypothetical protein
MSYSFEKNSRGDSDLVISGWEYGIGDSALQGHQLIQNIDVFTKPGMALVQFKSEKASDNSGTNEVTGLVKWMVQDSANSNLVYALDSDGKVYQATGTTNWDLVAGYSPASFGNGQGLGIYESQTTAGRSFLFVARATQVDVLRIDNGAWNLGWKTDLKSNSFCHPMWFGTDARLYIGNNQYIASFYEVDAATFVPGTPATYTWNTQALDLPSRYKVRSLTQLGQQLMIGTQIGSPGVNSNYNVADLFPWDKTSDTFNLPVSFNTQGVHQLSTINNIVYAWAGNGNTLSATNGSSTQTFKEFKNISNFDDPDIELRPYPDSICSLGGNEELLIGIGSTDNNVSPLGIYAVKDGIHVLRNTISTGETSKVEIGSIFPIDKNKFYVGWKSDTDQGIDIVGNSGRYEDWSATIDTDLIPTATFLSPKEFGEIEFKLGKPLGDDEGIRIYWRDSLTASWTLILQKTGTDIQNRMSYQLAANIPDSQYLQLRIQLLADGDETPWLSEVRLR